MTEVEVERNVANPAACTASRSAKTPPVHEKRAICARVGLGEKKNQTQDLALSVLRRSDEVTKSEAERTGIYFARRLTLCWA